MGYLSPSVLGIQDAGKSIKLVPGQELQIALEGNPTTGYSWEIAQNDNAVLSPVGDPEFQADSQLLGSGGKMILRFEGVAPGKTNLKLVYHRLWEKNVEPLETFVINVEVSS